MKKFGHYEVTEELGRGGMGIVYKGWEPSLNRIVAIKALGEHLLNDEDLVERFTREAKATAALNNQNVIQIYFIGKEQRQPYFAMEYIEGQSLDDILKGNNSLSVKHAKNILKQACMGLAAAHKINLVHRDIKPANLMLSTDGTLKIVDFGIARTREYGDKLTNTGEFVGTPGYLSPEVCIGKEVDERSDIFSLGIVFYEMLAGKVPFENDSPLGLMLEVVQADIPDIRTLNKKVDKKTSFILNKMIAKSPEERYQSCNDIIRDLGNVIENQTIASIKQGATTVVFQNSSNKLSEQVTLPGFAAITKNNLATPKKSKSSKKWLAAATLFTVVAAAGFGYVNGYLPIPNNSQNETATLFVNQDLLAENSSSDGIPEGNKADVTGNDTEVIDIFAGINEEFIDDNEDVAIIDHTGDLDLIAIPAQGELNTVAHVTTHSQQEIAETDTHVQSIATEAAPLVAKSVSQKTQKLPKSVYKPKAIALNKGVVVIALGDPAIANPVEKILENQLKQQGIKVMNEQFITGMGQLLNNGLDLAKLKHLIKQNGGQAMIIANVNYVGSQQLQYAGRSSELVNAQLDVDTYDIKTGDSIGNGFGAKINYTSLNATDQASDAVMQFADQLTSTLKREI